MCMRTDLREEAAEELEGDRVDARAVAEQRVLRPVAQLAVGVVVDPPDDVGRRLRRRHVGPGGHGPGPLDQEIEAERLWFAEAQTGLGRKGRRQHAEQWQGAE